MSDINTLSSYATKTFAFTQIIFNDNKKKGEILDFLNI